MATLLFGLPYPLANGLVNRGHLDFLALADRLEQVLPIWPQINAAAHWAGRRHIPITTFVPDGSHDLGLKAQGTDFNQFVWQVDQVAGAGGVVTGSPIRQPGDTADPINQKTVTDLINNTTVGSVNGSPAVVATPATTTIEGLGWTPDLHQLVAALILKVQQLEEVTNGAR